MDFYRIKKEDSTDYLSFPQRPGISEELFAKTNSSIGPGRFKAKYYNVFSWKELDEGPLGVINFSDKIKAQKISSLLGGTLEKVSYLGDPYIQYIVFFESSHGKAPLCGSQLNMFYFEHQDYLLTFNMQNISPYNPWIVKFKSKEEAESFCKDFPEQTKGKLSVKELSF